MMQKNARYVHGRGAKNVSLIHLAYVSNSRLGINPDSWQENLEHIISSARRLNAENGITGYLMFDGVQFAQIIEGEEPAVIGTFLRILADRSHESVNILVRGPILRRRFSDWHMGLALREGRLEDCFVRQGFILPGDMDKVTIEPLLALALELAGQAPPLAAGKRANWQPRVPLTEAVMPPARLAPISSPAIP
jgi:hypothetical protein